MIAIREVRNANSGGVARALRVAGLRPRRAALTLVELLVTITIISILASVLLGVAAVAADTAREARTKIVITRLHSLLVEHYDTYKSRRVRLSPAVEARIRQAVTDRDISPAAANAARAEARLYALREMMLMEMPDRWSDVNLNDVGAAYLNPVYLDTTGSDTTVARTGLAQVYYRRYLQLLSRTNENTGSQNTVDDIIANQSAECLYMIIMLATGDGEAPSLFDERDIGDTDGDGAPEFLDGWGRPIQFLRWAPGFESDQQLNANRLLAMTEDARRQLIAADHDPFDIFRRDVNAFRLVPLIYSAGSGETTGIEDYPAVATWRIPGNIDVVAGQTYFFTIPLLLYNPTASQAIPRVGAIVNSDAATDNITNHFITGE